MARASTVTLLSLDDFAAVMGISPAHFNSAATATVMPVRGTCSDLWFQYAWQDADRVSREDIAQEIANAEQDIADYLRYWPAPKWIAQEEHQYPRHHRPDVVQAGGYDVRGYRKAITADYGYIVAPGQRATSEIDNVAVVYSDEDGDGVNETATVSVATTLTNECEVKVYFPGYGGELEWEIRPARTKAITGGVFTATFWKWQFIDPDLWEALATTENARAIEWDVAGNVVTTVDVYREYNDTTETTAEFYWEPRTAAVDWAASLVCNCGGTGCSACTLTTQDGCVHIRDATRGILVPEPASYTDGAWSANCFSVCRDPDFVKVWYYAGYWDNRKRRSEVCEPLSRWWKQIIAYLATARIERPFCSCENVKALSEYLREDLARLGEKTSYQLSDSELINPFGTRRGEIMAWRKLSKIAHKNMRAAVV